MKKENGVATDGRRFRFLHLLAEASTETGFSIWRAQPPMLAPTLEALEIRISAIALSADACAPGP